MTKGVKCMSMMVPARHKELLKPEHENPPKMSLAFTPFRVHFDRRPQASSNLLMICTFSTTHYHKKNTATLSTFYSPIFLLLPTFTGPHTES